MTNIIRLGLILMSVTLVAAGALSGVNRITKPKIEALNSLKKQASLNAVLPDAAGGVIEPVVRGGEEIYYRGYADAGKSELVGYAVQAAGKGYSSTILTMVGVTLDGNVGAVKVMDQKETPGLGTKIEAEGTYRGRTLVWYEQLADKDPAGMAVDKDGGDIASVTGATISSRAVVNSVKDAVAMLEKELGGFKTPAAPADTAARAGSEGGAE